MSAKKKAAGKKKTKKPQAPFDPSQVKEQLLLYGLGEDSSRGERLRKVMTELQMPWRDLEPEDLYRKVGILAGLRDAPAPERKPPEEPPRTELMLMCGVSDERMDALFDGMRRQGLDIGHKAALTEHNRKWTLMALLKEVGGEHRVVQAYMDLNRLANSAMSVINSAREDTEEIIALRNAVAEAVQVMNREEPSEEQLTEAAGSLKGAYLKATGLREVTGRAVLDLKKKENGLWDLSVLVKEAEEDLEYEYSWNSGETGPALTDLPREELITRIVTVRAKDGYGSLSAQLEVPEEPRVTVREELDRLELQWHPQHAGINRPAVEHTCVEVFRDEDSLRGSMRFGPEVQSADLDDLEAGCEYTLKVWAENPAGRSDKAVIRLKTGD